VIEQTAPAFAHRLRKQLLFRFQRLGGKQIVSHDPRERHVGPHRHQVGKAEHGFASNFKTPALHGAIVSTMRFHSQTGHYVIITFLCFELAGFN
jgi:hypothetical protein